MLIAGDEATAALARVDALHTALTGIVLEGGDLDRIAAEVARVLEVGVLFTSTDGRERAGHLTGEQRTALARADLVDETGRLRVERIGADAARVAGGEVRSLRVAAGGEDLARLVCHRAEGSISPDDVHALERAAAVAALLITREQSITAVENKYQGDFLRDLFRGRAGDAGYVEEHATAFGWDLGRPVVVLVARIDPPPEGEESSGAQRRRWQERFSAAWRQVTATFGDGIPCVDLSSEVVTLLPCADPGADLLADQRADPRQALGDQDVVRRVVTAVAGDKGGGRRPFSVGVSRPVGSIGGLPAAYDQARRAVRIGRQVHGGGSTTFFDQLGVHRLLALVPDSGELRAFADDVLGPLADDTEEAADLRATLQVLLDTNFNVAVAARQQFFHYNTMRYRVGKLERLLGPLATDPHLRLDVAMALRVLDLDA